MIGSGNNFQYQVCYFLYINLGFFNYNVFFSQKANAEYNFPVNIPLIEMQIN